MRNFSEGRESIQFADWNGNQVMEFETQMFSGYVALQLASSQGQLRVLMP
jgi:hypothetical protein